MPTAHAPKILIPLLRVDARETPIDFFRLNGPFVAALNAAGALPLGVPIGVPHARLAAYFDLADGVLLQGGHDIHPRFFAPEEPLHPRVHSISEERDAFEIAVVRLADARRMPLLGICRGVQILNVARGGTIYQDQPTELPTEVAHFPNEEISIAKVTKDDLARVAHEVHLVQGTALHSFFGKDTISVNSLHHQAVKKVGKGLRIAARAEDGVVEAVESEDMARHWLVGVQWHPEVGERLPQRHSVLFVRFADAARRFAQEKG